MGWVVPRRRAGLGGYLYEHWYDRFNCLRRQSFRFLLPGECCAAIVNSTCIVALLRGTGNIMYYIALVSCLCIRAVLEGFGRRPSLPSFSPSLFSHRVSWVSFNY